MDIKRGMPVFVLKYADSPYCFNYNSDIKILDLFVYSVGSKFVYLWDGVHNVGRFDIIKFRKKDLREETNYSSHFSEIYFDRKELEEYVEMMQLRNYISEKVRNNISKTPLKVLRVMANALKEHFEEGK